MFHFLSLNKKLHLFLLGTGGRRFITKLHKAIYSVNERFSVCPLSTNVRAEIKIMDWISYLQSNIQNETPCQFNRTIRKQKNILVHTVSKLHL